MQRDGLALSIEIGNRTFEGRLPLLPHRYLVFSSVDELTDAATVETPIEDEDAAKLLKLEGGVEELETIRAAGELPDLVAELRGIRVLEGGRLVLVALDPDRLDVDAVGAVNVAAIALCWADTKTPLELEGYLVGSDGKPELRSFVLPGQVSQLLRATGRDLVQIGELAFHGFERLGIVDNRVLYRAGRKVREAVVASIPSPAEVEEAAGNSEARADRSTASTSSPV